MATTQTRHPEGNQQGFAQQTGEFAIGNDLRVARLGFGAMRITGAGIWGEPADRAGAIRVLRRAVELGINFIDTADSSIANSSRSASSPGFRWRPVRFQAAKVQSAA